MKPEKRGLKSIIAVGLALVLVAGLAGCVSFTAGHPFVEEPPQGTPLEAAQTLFRSMEEKNFDMYKAIVDPAYFQGATDEDLQNLRERWESEDTNQEYYWKAQFMDIVFEEIENDGSNAVVKVAGGLVQYTGKELFDTSEIKVDDYKNKSGKIVLKNIDGKWYVVSGGEIGGSNDQWDTPQGDPFTNPNP